MTRLVVTSLNSENLGYFRLNLEVALKYGAKSKHHLLVVHDDNLSRSSVDKVARTYFETVSYFKHDTWEKLQKFPTRENFIWQYTARHIEENYAHRYDCWLWWEQDACPLIQNWVDHVFDEKTRLKKAFVGYVYSTTHLPQAYMDRCGIWPSDISKHLVHTGALYAQSAPFDRLAGPDVMKDVGHTDKIIVDQGANFRFSEIKIQFPEACLLRGCDGRQQEVFLGRRDIGELDTQVRKDRYDSFLDQTDWPCGVFAFPYGEKTCYFNPAIAEHDGKLWLFTRRFRFGIPKVHGVGYWDKHSDLVIWRVRPDSMTVAESLIPRPPRRWDQENWEDPRVMVKDGQVYLSFATWVRDHRWTIRQALVKLDEDWSKFEVVAETNYGGNASKPESGSRHEKNWTWFDHDGWHCVYSPSPHLTFKAGKGHSVEMQWKARAKMVWEYGDIRGGTPPIRLNDKEYLSFFHSSERWRGNKRRYYMGAYTFEAKPPFEPLRMTHEPLLIGSEHDPRVFEGPLVIFPGGAIRQDDSFLVVFGVNDENCGWVKIPEKDLEGLLQSVHDGGKLKKL